MSVFLFHVNVGVDLAVGVYLDVIGAVVVVDDDVGVGVDVDDNYDVVVGVDVDVSVGVGVTGRSCLVCPVFT